MLTNSNDRYRIMCIYIYIYSLPVFTVDSCKLHVAYEVKVTALATVAKSKPILLAAWEFFQHLARDR